MAEFDTAINKRRTPVGSNTPALSASTFEILQEPGFSEDAIRALPHASERRGIIAACATDAQTLLLIEVTFHGVFMTDRYAACTRLAFDRPADRVLRITINRPEKLNAAGGA